MNNRGAGKQGYPVLLLLRSSWILILCPASCAANSSHYTCLKQISVQMCCSEKGHSGSPCYLPVVNTRSALGNLDLKSAFLWAVLRPCHVQRPLPTKTSPPICESVPVIPLQHLAPRNGNGAALICADHISIEVLQHQEGKLGLLLIRADMSLVSPRGKKSQRMFLIAVRLPCFRKHIRSASSLFSHSFLSFSFKGSFFHCYYTSFPLHKGGDTQLYSIAVGSAWPCYCVQAFFCFLGLPRHSRALFFIHQPAFDTESGNYFAAKSVQGRWETICRLLLE